jgi:Phage-related minor tail protein
MTDIPLRILLQAQDQASRVISGFGNQLLKMSGQFKPILLGAGLVAAAVIGIGAVSVKMAADFQAAMLLNEAHAGLAANQVQRVTDALMQMAPAVGIGPTQLAQALYPVLSGLSNMTDQAAKAKVALYDLNLAAQNVAGTDADINVVTKAHISTLNAYNLSTNNAALATQRLQMISDVMTQTIIEGNMKWDEYSRMIGKYMAVSAQSRVKITEANAALAVFTNTGETARLAGTHLASLFQSMSMDTDTLAKRFDKLDTTIKGTGSKIKEHVTVLEMVHGKMELLHKTITVKVAGGIEKLGMHFDVAKFKSMDLAQKIAYLEKITGGDEGKLKAILGNKTMVSTFEKLRDHIKDYQHALSDLNHSHGATADAFAKVSKGFNFAMSQAKAAIDVLLIKIGTALLPILTKIVGAVGPVVTWFLNFADAVGKNQLAMDAIKSVLIAVAGVITGVLLYALAAWAIAMIPVVIEWLAMTWPILLVGLIAAAVIFGIMQLVRHWGAVMAWLGALWKTISTAIGAAFSWLGDHVHGIITAIGGFFSGLGTKVHIFFLAWQIFLTQAGARFMQFKLFIESIIHKIGDVFSWLGATIHGVWDGIVSKIKAAINFIISIINAFIGGIDNIHVDVGPVHVGFAIPKIPYLASGGYVESSGLAMIHRGERVMPARTSPLGGPGAGGSIVNMTVNVYGPSRKMADDFIDEVSRRLRQKGNFVTWTSGGRA